MNQSDQAVFEFQDLCQARALDLDDKGKQFYFDRFRSELKNLDVADEIRSNVRGRAIRSAYTCVVDRRISKDKLAQERAAYRRAQFGYEGPIPEADENRSRRETLEELNDLWSQVVLRHEAVCGLQL